ncbi:MAG: amino acid adenylation domain-containing protein [Deltaproteobacteria bacterium]|nr:amino acid adenylation domain-containing protein [Deltaproteobacteria bacterium]
MPPSQSFSCYVIGSTTLAIKCTEILRAAGHEVIAVISDDSPVLSWARDAGLGLFSVGSDLKERLRVRPFEYLFSVVNPHILDEEVLAMPSKLAINYHDAPLPRYAGTHATSWALLANEPEHGVSWHVASKVVDAGDILVQRRFSIVGDTAFSLNTKCYEAAIGAFQELVDELAAGRERRTAQDLRQRSFFPRWRRPPSASVVSWSAPARELVTLARALDFGPHPNPLGIPKILFGGEVLAFREASVAETRSGLAPGTVVSGTTEELRVAAIDGDVRIRRLEPTRAAAAFAKHGPGAILSDPTPEQAVAIDALVAETAKHEPYWVNALARMEPLVSPYALVNPEVGSARRVERLSKAIRPDIHERLASVGADGAADALVAAWAAYLSRISGASQFDLGYAHPALTQAVGSLDFLFARAVPVRCELDEHVALAVWCETLGRRLTEARRRLTFLNDVVLRYPSLRARDTSPSALRVRVEVSSTLESLSANELTLGITPDGRQLQWVYDSRIYASDRVERMARQFECFLEDFALHPGRELSRLALLELDERRRQLVEWNQTGAFRFPERLHELFEAQVDRAPDAEALVSQHERLTYGELDARANQVAHELQVRGVGRESMVGLCVERSPELLVGLLGILKAGGAYVPLDPAYPADRLRFILEDARAPVLVTQERLRSILGGSLGDCRILSLDGEAEVVGRQPKTRPSASGGPESLAYVIYTSGSTGRPKGVAIEHHSPVSLIEWSHSLLSSAECRGVAFVTSVCFDLSIWEMFVPLSTGGKIILADNALQIPELPGRAEITLINTVPSAIRELVRHGGIPESVRVVCLAGEPLTPELVAEIYGVPTVEKVYDLYGPSETTTYSTWVLRQAGAHYTVGRPIGGTRIYLVDRNLEPVPVGVPGEILIGGEGVARGYHGRPELTAERFLPDPFSEVEGARVYKTGDLGRFYANGELELVGRIDHQVKVRGFRIELGEIESTLRAVEGVQGAVVVVREDQPGNRRLVAYVAGRDAELPQAKVLRQRLEERLPEYMVPAVFVRSSALPLNPSGKIDRKALPKPELEEPAAELVAPRDDLERRLAAIWREVLQVERVGVNDDYFERGGDSLRAVAFFAAVERELGKRFGLATLFGAPTIAKLADLLRQPSDVASWSPLVPIQPKGTKPPLFCVHARGGNVLFYRDLSNRLGDDQPFYGIQPQGLDGKLPYLRSVEEMARLYLRELRKVQPKGPYFLGGSSFGGTAAFEMAHQLIAAGEKVALLAVFDTGGPGYPTELQVGRLTRVERRLESLAARVSHRVWIMRTLDPEQRVDYVRAKARKARVKYKRQLRSGLTALARYLPRQVSDAVLPPYVHARWELVEFEKSIAQALGAYEHRVYPGRMILFRATKQPLGIRPDPTLGWGPLVPSGLEIHDVEGGHGELVVEPSVRFLSPILAECLAAARREHGIG